MAPLLSRTAADGETDALDELHEVSIKQTGLLSLSRACGNPGRGGSARARI